MNVVAIKPLTETEIEAVAGGELSSGTILALRLAAKVAGVGLVAGIAVGIAVEAYIAYNK